MNPTSSKTINALGRSYLEHFVLSLTTQVTKNTSVPHDHALFKTGGQMEVKILLNGVEIPEPVEALNDFMKRMEEHFEGVAGKRALEMVNQAGLDKIREVLAEADSQLRDKLREIGVNVSRED